MTRRLVFLCLVSCVVCPASLRAAERPSLFRGVVVADSPLGVRVVSIEEGSQAALADLRPEDIVIRAHDQEIRSIDEFATLSAALKGQVVSTPVVIFRSGAPRQLTLHLYSYPILRTWEIPFVPDFDVRFAEAATGRDYWMRLGRGFAQAGKTAEALDCYLNALHNVPEDLEPALSASTLLARTSEPLLKRGELAAGLEPLRQSVVILQHVFEFPLTDEQLAAIRRQLESALQALRAAAAARTPAAESLQRRRSSSILRRQWRNN
jgi:hypothetical protein